jgi:flagellar biosynthesis component FlhA
MEIVPYPTIILTKNNSFKNYHYLDFLKNNNIEDILNKTKEYLIKLILEHISSDHNELIYDDLNNILQNLYHKYILIDNKIKFDTEYIYDYNNKEIRIKSVNMRLLK